MKSFKYSLFTLLTAFVFIGASATVYAQSDTGAYDMYNKAIDFSSSGQYQKAIEAYQKAIEMAKGMKEGQKILEKSKSALPKLYYQNALSVYKDFQKSPSVSGINKAIDAFKTAKSKAEQYGNSSIASQAKGVITQLYYQKGVLQYKQESYDGALKAINTAIKRNKNFAKAYYQKSLIVKETGSVSDYLGVVDKAIKVANSSGQGQVANQIKQSAANQLVYIGAQRVSDDNYSGAVKVLEKALEYNSESVNAYFRMAQAYNSSGDWQKALDAAKKALGFANGGKASQAKLYYAIGNAYKGLGQYSKACEALSKADYGRFKQSVDHMMEFVLKCE